MTGDAGERLEMALRRLETATARSVRARKSQARRLAAVEGSARRTLADLDALLARAGA